MTFAFCFFFFLSRINIRSNVGNTVRVLWKLMIEEKKIEQMNTCWFKVRSNLLDLFNFNLLLICLVLCSTYEVKFFISYWFSGWYKKYVSNIRKNHLNFQVVKSYWLNNTSTIIFGCCCCYCPLRSGNSLIFGMNIFGIRSAALYIFSQ